MELISQIGEILKTGDLAVLTRVKEQVEKGELVIIEKQGRKSICNRKGLKSFVDNGHTVFYDSDGSKSPKKQKAKKEEIKINLGDE